MNKQDRIDILFTDENFQKDILNCDDSEKSRKALSEKYHISFEEFLEAKNLFLGLAFRKKEEIPEIFIRCSLQNMKRKSLSESVFIHKNRENRRLRIFSAIVAVLLIPFMIISAYFYFVERGSNEVNERKMDVLYTANNGVKTQVVLPDGSKVWLNSGTTLRCPGKFGARSRNVELNGEAYFEVVKNTKVPMFVKAGDIKVKVYGTIFDLNAYDDEDLIETSLVQGKVSIFPAHSKKEYLLNPGQNVSYSGKDHQIRLTEIGDMKKYISWKDGILLFNNDKFSDIIKKLNRWYDVNILLTNESIGHYVIHATFNNENIENVLTVLSKSMPIDIEYPQRKKMKDGSYSERKIIIKYKLK